MGAHTSNLTRCLFALKSVNINVLRSAAPKLALVPASRYNCDIKIKRFFDLPLEFSSGMLVETQLYYAKYI